MRVCAADEAATRAVAAELAGHLGAGDVVLLEGPLGAGKTTFVRGVLGKLGHDGAVRSPTFGLVQVYETFPPVLHADLYRVSGAAGLGLEEALETHLVLVEWPDRLGGLVEPEDCWRVRIGFSGSGREIEVHAPSRATR